MEKNVFVPASRELAEKILDFLQEKAGTETLPEMGIIAGQAVAEAYFRVNDIDIHTRVKDIDIFYSVFDNNAKDKVEKAFLAEKKRPPRIVKDEKIKSSAGKVMAMEVEDIRNNFGSDMENEYERGDGRIRVERGTVNYYVHQSQVLKNINFVAIAKAGRHDIVDANEIAVIVEQFDINAVKIGVDPRTKEMYISPDFEKFIKTRQVEQAHVALGLKQFERLVSKKDYYKGAYFNLGYEANLLLAHHFVNKSINGRIPKGASFLYEKYAQMSEAQKKDLESFFDVEKKDFYALDSLVIKNVDDAKSHDVKFEMERLMGKVHNDGYDISIVYKGEKHPRTEILKNYIMQNGAFAQMVGKTKSVNNVSGKLRERIDEEIEKVSGPLDEPGMALIIAYRKVEVAQLVPKLERFLPSVISNIETMTVSKRREGLMRAFLQTRQTAALVFNKNKLGKICDFYEKKVEKISSGYDRITYTKNIISMIKTFSDYNIDIIEVMKLPYNDINRALKHTRLLLDAISVAHIRKNGDITDSAKKLISNISELEKDDDRRGYIGLIETDTIPRDTIFDLDELDRSVREMKNKEKENDSSVKIDNELLSGYKDYQIKQLTTSIDIMAFGNQMSNCIGGYADQMLQGYYAIFDVKDGEGERYALSMVIRTDEDGRTIFKYDEMKKFANREPNTQRIDDMREFAEILTTEFNGGNSEENKIEGENNVAYRR